MKQNIKLIERQERKAEKGFTLVELAIVMIIIGLLIGGVLKGQELIENAKVTATISQVKGFQAALNTFKDTYSATPGDMRNATTRLAGCGAGNANTCIDGSGNSLVSRTAAATNPPFGDVTALAAASESALFWKHLALADLITGVNPASSLADGQLAWGASHPASSLRGGYEFYYDTNTSDIAGSTGSGHLLRMSNGGLGATAIGGAGTEPATGLQAANIDRKLDDGRPGTGTVLGGGTTSTATAQTGCLAIGGVTYDEQTESKSCLTYFLIDG